MVFFIFIFLIVILAVNIVLLTQIQSIESNLYEIRVELFEVIGGKK